MIFSLDNPAALDPAQSGAKAAWLARGRRAGLPVLPGVVVAAPVSHPYLAAGVAALERASSGRARIEIMGMGLPDSFLDELDSATAGYSPPLVVRSSSILEGSGEWSGAFTSYLDVRSGELGKAILGCYASAFTQHTVERFHAAGLSPVAAGMAVLIQPALDPDFGGTAHVQGDEVTITAVRGSPAPLVQGWEPGAQARVTREVVKGGEAVDLLGQDRLRSIAETVFAARDATSANACEWAVQDGSMWLLQLQRFAQPTPSSGIEIADCFTTTQAGELGRLIRRYPGPLGEELVLPWAVADPGLADYTPHATTLGPAEAFRVADEHAAALTATVWGRPKGDAARAAGIALRDLRGADPAAAFGRLLSLKPPDPDRARLVLDALAEVRTHLAAVGAVAGPELGWHLDRRAVRAAITGTAANLVGRIGFDRWDPFNATMVAAHGVSVRGTPVSDGVAYGRMCLVTQPGRADHFRPRDVVVGVYPEPGLAALLFDAAALITTGGGPAAHLFESARALAIPALCATRIEDVIGRPVGEPGPEWALAVDGSNGMVYGVPW